MTDSPTPIRKPSDSKCNARLMRGEGYCNNGAGMGTGHVGDGRCRLHGGISGVDGTEDLFLSIGLGRLIELAETMAHDDQEYLYDSTLNGLTVSLAMLTNKLLDPMLTPREVSDLTASVSRLDIMIARHPNTVRGEEGVESENVGDDTELARVLKLAKGG